MSGIDRVANNFPLFVLIGGTAFTLLGVVVLLIFRSIFNKFDRQQREMDEELRRHGLR